MKNLPTALASLFMIACTGSGGQDAGLVCSVDAGGPPSGLVGLGNPDAPSQFTALVDGAMVGVVIGSQGSQHVWIQMLAQGICPDRPNVSCTLTLTDTGRVVGGTEVPGVRWRPSASNPGQYVSPLMTCQVADGEYCALLHGGRLTVHTHVDDGAGNVADAEGQIVLNGFVSTADPSDVATRNACCADYTNTRCWPNGAPDGGATDAGDASMDGGASADVADGASFDGAGE